MQPQLALDRGQHPRRDARLVVSYRPMDPTGGYDITQTRNVSQGGLLLTTASAFEPGERLAIQARLPFWGTPRLVQGATEAVESREIVRSLLYEIRVRFVDLDRRSFQIIGDFCAGRADVPSAGG